jgi:hypothetical protein
MHLAIQVRLQTELYSAIEGFRRNEPDIPTRPEAVRRLLERALDVAQLKQATAQTTLDITGRRPA